MTRYVLIPTKNPNKLLTALVEVIAASGWQSVVMVYAEHINEAPAADHVLIKAGDTFNSWANQAFDYLLKLEPEPLVVIMNDDIEIHAGGLTPLFDALEHADLVSMSGRGGMVTPAPLEPHLFGIRPSTMRLPDPDGLALWWWNTDHLYHEAMREGKRVTFVSPIAYNHRSANGQTDGSWRYPAEFQHSVQADHDWFWSQWSHLDPSHTGCYLNWWPSAIPAGQQHIREWGTNV
jgi:hypothetical protein